MAPRRRHRTLRLRLVVPARRAGLFVPPHQLQPHRLGPELALDGTLQGGTCPEGIPALRAPREQLRGGPGPQQLGHGAAVVIEETEFKIQIPFYPHWTTITKPKPSRHDMGSYTFINGRVYWF